MKYRFLLRPAWLASMAGLLVLAALFVRLGWWQFDRAHRQTKISATELAQRIQPVPLAGLLADGTPASDSAIGRAVRVSGVFDTQRQLLVPDRQLNGRTGYYVIAPLKLTDGSAVVVNRGWTAGTTIPAAPSGPVTVNAWLAAPESADAASAAAVSSAAQDPAHRIDAVDIASLVNQWPYALDRAYVNVLTQDPPDASGLASVPAPAPPSGKIHWNILNLGYTAQWWLFTGVAIWWYASYVRRIASPPVDGDADEDEDVEAEATPRSPVPAQEPALPAAE